MLLEGITLLVALTAESHSNQSPCTPILTEVLCRLLMYHGASSGDFGNVASSVGFGRSFPNKELLATTVNMG